MSAPAGVSHAAQWQAWAKTWAYLLAPDEPAERRSRADEPAAPVDTADHRRPPGAGVRPMQHEAASAFSGRQRGFEEDDRSDRVTSTAD
jgi:hypothetical protein